MLSHLVQLMTLNIKILCFVFVIDESTSVGLDLNSANQAEESSRQSQWLRINVTLVYLKIYDLNISLSYESNEEFVES